MNILFSTIVNIKNIDDRGIFQDLLRKFRDEGHNIYVLSSAERREKEQTHLVTYGKVRILRVKTFNLIKTNMIEKGIGILAIEYQYLFAIKKYFSNVIFDLVLYSTPPITFTKVINYIKRKDNAYSYLLLKDIFPQNAIDMKMFKENGLLHKIFLKKERDLYRISDSIGCMSEANKKYLLDHNNYIESNKVEINPNSIIPINKSLSFEERNEIRSKYSIPLDKIIFVYGGNLGIPQGIDFLLDTIANTNREDVFFLVVGSGTEFDKINKWFDVNNPQNAKLISGLPKNDYDTLLQSCDVGLIFLHKDFTIPNFPARFLSYLEMKMPIIAATDDNTDIGDVIVKNNCGYWIHSGDNSSMQNAISRLSRIDDNFISMKNNAWYLLQKDYLVERSYNLIIKKIVDVS